MVHSDSGVLRYVIQFKILFGTAIYVSYIDFIATEFTKVDLIAWIWSNDYLFFYQLRYTSKKIYQKGVISNYVV